MVKWNPDLLNEVLAPGVADFTAAEIIDLIPEFDQSTHWMSNHFLNSALGVRYSGDRRINIVTAILRAQLSFAAYHEAKAASDKYLAANDPHNPSARSYFALVGKWEMCVHNVHLFMDAFNKFAMPAKAYTTGDNSEAERLCRLSNDIKHLGRVTTGEHTIPMWLTNEGLQSVQSFVSYREIADIIRELARCADILQYPASASGHEAGPMAQSGTLKIV